MFRTVLLLSISLSFFGSMSMAASVNRTTTECQRRFVNDNGNSVTEIYFCPDFDGLPDEVHCCHQLTERCCMSPKTPGLFDLPKTTAIIIATTAVLAAAILTGVMVACCCWEKCPLYLACRAEAKPDYIAKPEDVAGLSLMPDDNVEDVKTYAFGKAASGYDRV